VVAILSFTFRVAIGVVFLFAGLAKISDPVRFLLSLREFQLFPDIITRLSAIYLPWLEFVLGFFIILGLLHKTASLMLASLNVVFALAILSVIVRGIDIDCGCFGLLADTLKIPDRADIKAIFRNIIFTTMCLYVFWSKKTVLSLENYIESRRQA